MWAIVRKGKPPIWEFKEFQNDVGTKEVKRNRESNNLLEKVVHNLWLLFLLDCMYCVSYYPYYHSMFYTVSPSLHFFFLFFYVVWNKSSLDVHISEILQHFFFFCSLFIYLYFLLCLAFFEVNISRFAVIIIPIFFVHTSGWSSYNILVYWMGVIQGV